MLTIFTNHLIINFTYLATLRTHSEERIARHEDRLERKKKRKDEGEENFPRQRKYIFSNDFERDGCSKGTVARTARREVGREVGRRAKTTRRRREGEGGEGGQERGKKRKQVGR